MDISKITTKQVILILGIIIIVIPPILILPAFSEYFDFSTTGPIGDTLGGITAPFVNSIAAILVFIAFKEQIKANNLLKDQQSFQHVEMQINRLEDDFFELSKLYIEIRNSISDSRRVQQYYEDNKQVYCSINQAILRKVIYTFTVFLNTKELIDKMENKEFPDKKIKAIYRIIYQGDYKLIVDKLNSINELKTNADDLIKEILLKFKLLENTL